MPINHDHVTIPAVGVIVVNSAIAVLHANNVQVNDDIVWTVASAVYSGVIFILNWFKAGGK